MKLSELITGTGGKNQAQSEAPEIPRDVKTIGVQKLKSLQTAFYKLDSNVKALMLAVEKTNCMLPYTVSLDLYDSIQNLEKLGEEIRSLNP
jgi:hypothetical protein